jgi:hypothetical protein
MLDYMEELECKLQAAELSAAAAKKEAAELLDLAIDCWSQMAVRVEVDGEEWDSDGCLSTCEWLAAVLLKRGLLVRHPTREVYRWADDTRH